MLRAAAAARRRFALSAPRRASLAAAAPPLPPHFLFALPPLSPAMQSARVLAWHVAPGARLLPGEPLCDVATDTLLEAPSAAETVLVIELHEEATVAALLQPAGGARLALGAPLALLCEDARDVATLAAAAARGYRAGDPAAVAPLWQAHLSAAPPGPARRGCS